MRAFRRFLFLPARSLTTSGGRTAGLGAMLRRTKAEVERYVASVQAAASSPREVSAAGRAGPGRVPHTASPRSSPLSAGVTSNVLCEEALMVGLEGALMGWCVSAPLHHVGVSQPKAFCVMRCGFNPSFQL